MRTSGLSRVNGGLAGGSARNRPSEREREGMGWMRGTEMFRSSVIRGLILPSYMWWGASIISAKIGRK